MEQPDILIFLSDQHDGRVMHCAGHAVVRTPNLDAIAATGTLFQNAYTPCPLCVPARMSFLSGQLPMHTGVYTNKGSLASDTPTFLHSLANLGYDTVLCGRMHFEGIDQRHGFTKRIAGDITPTAIGAAVDSQMQLGLFAPTLTEAGCLQMIGSGNSPTLEYDRYVVSKAVDYLSVSHDKPQCIVVGTYGPHFPYIAPEELYRYYREHSILPPTLGLPVDKPYTRRMRDTDEEIVLAVQAAYWAMIEFEDACIGQVYEAWQSYLTAGNRRGIFSYLSDHGDHAGDRGFYGKQSLYEASVHIPMMFTGHSIPEGTVKKTPVSLMDVGPTLLSLVGAFSLPAADGEDFSELLLTEKENTDRSVVSEWISNPYAMGTEYGRMIRQGKYKYISFPDYPEENKLFLPNEDYYEQQNLISVLPNIAAELHEKAFVGVDRSAIVQRKNLREKGYNMVSSFGRNTGGVDTEMWPVTEAALQIPENYISSRVPLPPMFRKYMQK